MDEFLNTIDDGNEKIYGSTKSFLNEVGEQAKSLVSTNENYGMSGFVFDIADESSIELNSDITDHYVEDNTAVQDDIALQPEIVTLKGFVGEWVYKESSIDKVLQKGNTKLTAITQYLPKLTNFANKIYQTAEKVSAMYDTLNRGVDSLYGAYKDSGIDATKQSEAFLYFESCWKSKQLFKIQTPYKFYEDMAIKTIKVIQSADTVDKSKFEITFKKIRKVKSASSLSKKAQGRLKSMTSKVVNNGLIKGAKTTLSSIKGWF